MATSWAETGPVTYVYHLRRGVKFWDGDELTSTDAVFSMEQYWHVPGSVYSSLFVGVKDIAASGPYTVVVTLTRPNASWAYAPAEVPGIFEMKFYQAHEASFGDAGTLVMGTGPWEINSFDPTTGVELSANPNWWGGKVPVQDISVKIFANETSLELAMRAGEIDLDTYVLDTKAFATTSGAKLLTAPSETDGVFSMNTQEAPWNDVHVRRAVAYALNRTDIIAAAGGFNTPVYTFYPPLLLRSLASQSQVNALISSVPQYRYSIAKATAELAQSAYPHGFSTTLVEYDYGSSLDISEVIAAELQKIGINAQVKFSTNLAWEAAVAGPDLKRPTTFATGYCGGPDISTCDQRLGSWNLEQGQINFADWAPPAVDVLLKSALAATDPAKRFAVYAKLLRTVQTQDPYIGLFAEGISIALSRKFTVPGYVSDPNLVQAGAYALNVKLAN